MTITLFQNDLAFLCS